jgi:flagellar biosynthetic protein FlhB
MAESGEEKTEEPTQRRREEARQEGNIPRSNDLTAALSLLAAVVLMDLLGLRLLEGLMQALKACLTGSHTSNPTRVGELAGLVQYVGQLLGESVVLFTLAIMLAGAVALVGQVGFVITPKPLQPSFSKLSPIKGVTNLFNLRALMRLVMSLGKLALIAAVAGFVIARDLEWLQHLAHMELTPAFFGAAQFVYELSLKLVILLLILAIIDYVYQRWQHEQDLKMTKQQVKDEMKRMEGDPMVKQRRARVAKQLTQQRQAQEVPDSDVVVTNPTHYAVALRYDAEKMNAPSVVAKGADLMAVRIRQIAASHEIPIVERKPLARALYQQIEVGQEIPPDHYAAVAEILAYVYRISGSRPATA